MNKILMLAVAGWVGSCVRNSAAEQLVASPSNLYVQCDSVPALDPGCTEEKILGNCVHNYALRRICGGATQMVYVVDTSPPVLVGVPANASVSCDAVPGPAIVAATDNCTPTVFVTYVQTQIDGSCVNNYALRRVWTATDWCGNSLSATQLVTVSDALAPVLEGVPANANVTCGAVPGPASVTGRDNCSPTVTMTYVQTRIDGNCTNNYTLRRVWTGTDPCGSSRSATQLVTVTDTTPPSLTCPALITITGDAQGRATIPMLGPKTLSDNCSPSSTVAVTQNPPAGTVVVNVLTTMVEIAAFDPCGNGVTGSAPVVVRYSTLAFVGDMSATGDQIRFWITGPTGTTAMVKRSTNTQDWIDLQAITFSSNAVNVQASGSGDPRQFFRVTSP